MNHSIHSKLEVNLKLPKMSHGQSCVFLGSCFSDELGQMVRNVGFETLVNPGGTIFHPFALAKLIRWSFEQENNLRIFQQDDLFFSWDLSGVVYGMSEQELLNKISTLRTTLRNALRKASHLFVTFGTAWAYRLKTDGELVANCHKQSQMLFQKENSSLEELEKTWKEVLSILIKENPTISIIFTVSPVRHAKDGWVENNRSKSRLLLTLEKLANERAVYYFPVYEFVVDALRDYRYFKTDGMHPNEEAIQEIWKLFQDCFFSEETMLRIHEWQQIRQAEQHKILYPKSQAARKHLETTMKRKAQFLAANPLFFLP